MPFEGPTGEKLRTAVRTVVIMLGIFLLVQTISTFQSMRYIGAGLAASNTISVSGHGEASGVPDIATFSFSVVSGKATVALAQNDAAQKINAITAYLKGAGVADKDIQTSDYSVYPKYEYVQQACTSGYCPGGKQVLTGYEVSQSTTVKVRDTAKAGGLLSGVGGKGATNVSGLQFTFDKPDTLQTQARAAAIADAKTKADALAQALGVSLVRVVSFSENGNNPGPIMYGKGMMAADSALTAPEISVGQNKVQDDVSITYEIR